MAIAWGMVVFGGLLIVGGWKNLSIGALARGDANTPKPKVTAGGTGLTSS